MSIKYSEIFSADQILSAGPDDIIVIAVVDGTSSTGYTTKAIKKSNLIADPLFTSLTTTGASGASTLVAGVLNIPTYGGGIVDSVTGLDTDNTDPENPIVQIAVDGVTITGEGTPASPLVSVSDGFTHYLGEEFEGGVIYYLYKDNLGVERGLIVNKTESTAAWQNIATATGSDRTWDGEYNTNLMTDSPAKDYVTSLGAGWYLPSIDELNLLFDNRYSAQKALNEIVGADLLSSTTNYWSSTESSITNASYFFFDSGGLGTTNKINTKLVRAIRSF